MVLLNLLMVALFSVFGLFETGGSGSGGDDGGQPGKSGAGGDGSASDTDDADDDADDDAAPEVKKWKALARKHERRFKSLGVSSSEEVQQLREAAQRLRDAEEADKSDGQKAKERADAAEARAVKAEAQLLRMAVAAEKGLTPGQAKRLMGATREELEADADELLEAFTAKDEPLRRPAARPRSGNVPGAEAEDNNPATLAALIPRT